MVSIAVMGHGVVGSGVVEVLLKNGESIEKRAKEKIDIKYVLDLRTFPDSPLADRFTTDFEKIVNDDDIKIVVEVMGGLKPAYEYVKRCLEAGKSVVTSNKELVAAKGAELIKIARDRNVNFLFEASVGGGIPILRPLSQCLAANELSEIAGILNGTTNFILSKMIGDKMAFDDALKLAQSLGYAEKDPTADIEGGDACRKICILAALAFGKHVYPESVHTEGITKITLKDVEYAAKYNSVIKLIGMVKEIEENSGKLQICVAPMLVNRDCQLSTVDGVFNGILVNGDATDEVLFYGKGAGKLPTASAVVADVIDCVKHLHARKYLFWEDCDGSNVEPYEDDITAMYFRVKGDIETIKASAAEKFGYITVLDGEDGECAFVTKPAKISDFEAWKESQGDSIINSIRVF